MKKAGVLMILLLGGYIQSEAQNKVVDGVLEYTTDADGNRHGLYQMYFEFSRRNVSYSGNFEHGLKVGLHKCYDRPGVLSSETVYRKGKEVEHKYYGNIVKFGNSVRGVYEHVIYKDNGVTVKYEWHEDKNKLVQVCGELPNGKGEWSQIFPKDVEDRIPLYTEKYFDNDTTYVWFGYSTDKKQLSRKFADGYLREYDQDGNIIQQHGSDVGIGADTETRGKTNYKKNVNADRTLEEWDEDGIHYAKSFYPDLGKYSEERLDKGKDYPDIVRIYTLRTAKDGESACIKQSSEICFVSSWRKGAYILCP